MSDNLLYHVSSGEIDKVVKSINTESLLLLDSGGDSALHIAVANNNEAIVRLLINNGINVNIQNNEGKTPLHYAAEVNALPIAMLILNSGGDPMIADYYDNQPLWTAVFNVKGKNERHLMVELFLKAGLNVNRKNIANRSPLDFARQVQNTDLVELLERYKS